MLRDILTGDTPIVFRRGELYALAALGACITVVACHGLDVPRAVTIVAGVAVGFALRMGSLRFGWTSWAPGC